MAQSSTNAPFICFGRATNLLSHTYQSTSYSIMVLHVTLDLIFYRQLLSVRTSYTGSVKQNIVTTVVYTLLIPTILVILVVPAPPHLQGMCPS